VFADAGAYVAFATTTPQNAAAVVEGVNDQIRRVVEGELTADDVQVAIRAVSGRRAINEESNLDQARGTAVSEVSGTLESTEEYLARLRLVTPDEVRRVAAAYLHPQFYTLVVNKV